jgi:predicted RNase H-like nuclease (RuvC/YqgF family)
MITNSGNLMHAIQELNQHIMAETAELKHKESTLHQNEAHKAELEAAEKKDEMEIAQKTREIEKLKQEIRDKQAKVRESEREHEKLKADFGASRHKLDEHMQLKKVQDDATKAGQDIGKPSQRRY